MSIKDLFNKKSTNISVRSKRIEDFSEVESIDLAKERNKSEIRFSPQIDFEDPAQFARYGLAKKYYKDAIEYICKTYPYDGSLNEKQKWHNESSDLVNYFFDNRYPRNNGYITIGKDYGTCLEDSDLYCSTDKKEYIYFKGTYNEGNVYNIEKNKEYNLKIDGQEGNTIEFYLKKEDFLGSHKQVIFDGWNSEDDLSDKYGRVILEIHPGVETEKDKIYLKIYSGSVENNFELGNDLNFIDSWKHYAVSYVNHGINSMKAQLLVNGNVVDTKIAGSSIGRIYGAMQGQIGSLITNVKGTQTQRGWGKLSGSIDEFRFWKKKRTDKQVSLNYFTTIGGGTNTDDSNTDLGIYYKFNEGIYDPETSNSFDSIILDYSGRVSNGKWIGYTLGSRSTESAMVISGITKREFKDPVVYMTHKHVVELINRYSSIGIEHDSNNISSLYNSLPSWKIEEDLETGGMTQGLLQIMSEVFDEIHNKISFLPTLKNIEYRGENPLSFSSKLLQNVGFDFVDIFNNTEAIEIFLDKNDKENYENKIYKIKNIIYQNVYNNIININKSKGTIKSFRNLLHCFGIGEEILKIQMHANNTEFTVKDTFRQSSKKKTSINFNNQQSYGGVIVQQKDEYDDNSVSYIRPSSDLMYLGNTLETEIFFPKKFDINDPLFVGYPYYSASLFGTHEDDSGMWAATDRCDLQVFAVREELESSDVYFRLLSSYLNIDIRSELLKDVYNDTKWNFALRVRPERYPLANYIEGTDKDNFVVELYGASYVQDLKENSFLISKGIDYETANQYFRSNKRIYIGSHRKDFFGEVISTDAKETSKQYCDVELLSARFWNSYLQDSTIDLHAKTSNIYGAKDEQHKTAIQQYALEKNAPRISIEQNKTMSMHWNYLEPKSTTGEFYIRDASSGSVELLNDNFMGKYTQNMFTGIGRYFTTEQKKLYNTRYINATDIEMPESISPDDLIDIVEEYDDLYERERKIVDYYYTLEKNLYNVISKEMIYWLGTVNEFNNIIGNPKNRYRESYEGLELLRSLFFKNVENEPDFDKFLNFYKWIDDSISSMVEYLIPASMNFNPSVVNVVESHVLERNKYRHKLPTLEFEGEPPINSIRGINEMLYDWKYGHAPLSGLENQHCYWWKYRAERVGQLADEREKIFQSIKKTVDRNFNKPYNLNLEGEKVTVYTIAGSKLTKKRDIDIIINEVGMDLTGTVSIRMIDLLPSNIDCEDE